MSTDEKLVAYLKQVTADLKRTRARLREVETSVAEPVAIVAMACRFPGGADSPERLWDLVDQGRDVLDEFPGDRNWDVARLGPEVRRAGGFLSEAADFDAGFFGISPREALAMDPQQRLLLETTWEALERAGVRPSVLRESTTGVFVGMADQRYGPRDEDARDDVLGHILTGTSSSIASGRLAYVLGTEGPALSVDTACSSSLVALHLAMRSLRNGECTRALVGGAAVMADAGLYVEFAQQGGLAPDARCKAFAAAADGTGWAEGVGTLFLRRLSDAQRDGDPVLAVIRGSAVNSDGASNGLTAPNGPSQQRVIRSALHDAGLSPQQIDAVEAHGTGTRLGDPVEALALIATYGQDRPEDQPLWLGSLKSNIGHAQAAAGLGGVMKMVMALRHAALPKTLHVDAPTDQVDWSQGEVRLLTEARSWPETGRPRRAAVSSFGMSGTNAHVVLEQAPEVTDVPEVAFPADGTAPTAWFVSARDEQALRDTAVRLRDFVEATPDVPVSAVAAALAASRDRHNYRAVVVGTDRESLLHQLDGIEPARVQPHGGLALLFSGEGADLRDAHPVFADSFDEVCAAFGVGELHDGPRFAFAVGVALARLLEHWGLGADHVLGDGIGQFAAAHVAGVFSLDDACRLVDGGPATGMNLSAPRIPLYSGTTGAAVTDAEAVDPEFWAGRAHASARFRDALDRLIDLGATSFLEIGSGGLATSARERLDGVPRPSPVASTAADTTSLLVALGELSVAGAPVPWEAVLAPAGAPRLDLPTYPFQRQRFWLATSADTTAGPRLPVPASPQAEGNPLAGLDPAELEHRLRALVRTAVADVLGYHGPESVDPDRPFSEIGIDSMSAVRLANRLSADTALSQPATLAFDHPTPAAVVVHLMTELLGGDEIQAARGARGAADEPIAIVGLACRFPGAENAESLWELLRAGGDSIGPFPTDRGWRLDGLDASVRREGGFLSAPADFDADFFGISPREAVAMDPQQRILLEVAWEAVERAGIDATSLRGSRTGVYAGVAGSDYVQAMSGVDGAEGHLMTGTAASVMSGRIAYALGFEGPTLTVDTACSSSLVALHLATRALRSGECDLALAGGVTVMSTESGFLGFAQMGGLSADARCKAFDDGADGTAWSEGAGVLVVERLSDARRNGHRVLAVVRGSAVNSDGASNGLTAPNGPSQQRVIRAALADARLDAAEVDAVEAHGTGTPLGDPIEAQALLATYGREHGDDRPLWLGSLKSNIGHTMAAAGVGGVIKMVQALRAGVLPATLHLERPSSRINWSSGALRLLTEQREWPELDHPRRAGVSAFGMSGTNAHVVLEQAPAAAEPEIADPGPLVLPWVLSAKSPAALREQASRLLDAASEDVLGTARALLTTRATFEHRAVVLGGDRDALVAGLTSLADGEPDPELVVSGTARGFGRSPVWIFPGQGSQWPGMATGLLDTSPVFAAKWAECDRSLRTHLGWSITDAVRSGERDEATEADVVQPLLFAMMVSLAEMWKSWGITPSAVVGHSQGEIAAACVAGALSLDDAAACTVLRARALRELSGQGGMLSLAAPRDDVEQWIQRWSGAISVAVLNGPSATAVTGELPALRELFAEATARRIRVRWIDIDYASHSAQVEELRAKLIGDLGSVSPVSGQIPFFSTVTADWIDTAELTAEYWYRNLRQPVRLVEAVTALVEQDHHVFTEISPHPVLTMPVAETAEQAGATPLVVASLRRGEGTPHRLLGSLAELFANGVPVDLTRALPEGEPVELPTYPFQRKRFWPEAPRSTANAVETGPVAYETEWVPVTEPPDARADDWLVLVPGNSVPETAASALAALKANADRVVVLGVGSEDVGVDTEIDVAALAARVRSELGESQPAGVLSLVALDETPLPNRVPFGVAATLVVLRALETAEVDAPLWCATRGAVGDAPENPAQAAVWGMGRVAALERPDRWGGLIDLPSTVDDKVSALLRGTLAGSKGEDQIAVRADGVLVRRLVHGKPGSGPGWTPRGTVLVTGGTGALGAHVARWLATGGAEHVVLISRGGPNAPGAAELAEEVRALGAKATVTACDTTDPDSVAAFVAGLRETGERVRAVVHTAGVGVLAPISDTTTDELATVLDAKVSGAIAIDTALDPSALDAVVYFSSVSAVWGVGDHGAYSAANAVLDARAAHLRAQGVPALSVAWGPWAGEGMADDPRFQENLRRSGVRLLDPNAALRMLGDGLADGRTELAVADIDWPAFVAAFTLARPTSLFSLLPEVSGGPAVEDSAGAGSAEFVATLHELSAAEQHKSLLGLVLRHIAQVLEHDAADDVRGDRAFRDLGFDSLTGLQFRNRLNQVTGLKLPATVVFDQPTPEELATHLHTLLVPEDGGTESEEAEIRRALATLPIAALRRAGVLDVLKSMTDNGTEAEPEESASASIDEMDASSLLLLAQQNIAN